MDYVLNDGNEALNTRADVHTQTDAHFGALMPAFFENPAKSRVADIMCVREDVCLSVFLCVSSILII